MYGVCASNSAAQVSTRLKTGVIPARWRRGEVEQAQASAKTENSLAKNERDKTNRWIRGLERRALKIGDQYYDEEFRVKFLS